jgi:lipopolysaccharide export system permease protein
MMAATLAARLGFDRLRFKKVDKVVALSVIGGVLLAWFVVVALDAMQAFVGEINDVGTGDYTLAKAVAYILLTVPRRMYQYFAYGALIGGLMGMGALAASGELTALRAAGMSKLRICASVVLALTILTAFVALMGEVIAPRAQQKAESLMQTAKNRDIAIGKGGTLWARDGETVINAKRAHSRANKGSTPTIELSEVRVFEFTPAGQLSALSIAKTATHINGEWTLHDVRRTDFVGRSATSKIEETAQWKSQLDPDVLAVSAIHPEYLSMNDLAHNIDYMKRNKQDSDAARYQTAYWGRIFYPLNVLVLAFCAVPFAFGSLRTGGLGKRLFMGMALAISYYFFQKSVVSMGAVYNFNLALVNALPSLLLAVAAFVYFRRNA